MDGTMAEKGRAQLDIDALEILIQAIREYLSELKVNYDYLQQAAGACQMAMGNDELGRMMVEKMEEALEGLRITAEEAQDVANKMVSELRRAMETRDRMQNICIR